MAKQELKDRTGRLLGWLETVGGITYIKDRSGKSHGMYSASTGKTTTMAGVLVGYGNLLTNLLPIVLKVD